MNSSYHPKTTPPDIHPELPIDPDAVQPGITRWPPHFTPLFVAVVFVFGCFGTYCRYWVGQELPASNWPAVTFTVNMLGAFLLGLLLEGLARLGADTGALQIARLAVGTGFMGAFTTYSSFAVDILSFLQHGKAIEAFAYAGAMVIAGIALSALGIQLAAVHHKRRSAT